jgi:hypothetical protein
MQHFVGLLDRIGCVLANYPKQIISCKELEVDPTYFSGKFVQGLKMNEYIEAWEDSLGSKTHRFYKYSRKGVIYGEFIPIKHYDNRINQLKDSIPKRNPHSSEFKDQRQQALEKLISYALTLPPNKQIVLSDVPSDVISIDRMDLRRWAIKEATYAGYFRVVSTSKRPARYIRTSLLQ